MEEIREEESRDISPSLNDTLRLECFRSWKTLLTLRGEDEEVLLEELLEELEGLLMILTLDRLPLDSG